MSSFCASGECCHSAGACADTIINIQSRKRCADNFGCVFLLPGQFGMAVKIMPEVRRRRHERLPVGGGCFGQDEASARHDRTVQTKPFASRSLVEKQLNELKLTENGHKSGQ
jgi:hypothetical protein